MQCCQNKKSRVSWYLIGILIVLFGFAMFFFLVPVILNKTSVAYADSICKGSVAFREKARAEIGPSIKFLPDPKFDTPPTPLFCKTSTFELPEDKNADKNVIKKQFANLVASCWDRYGEGCVEDVFRGEGGRAKNNCQVCYIVNLGKTSKFDGEYRLGDDSGAIPFDEFTQYLFTTPYPEKVFPDKEVDDCRFDGGFCINSEKEEDCSGAFVDKNIDNSNLLINKGNSACKNKDPTSDFPSCCYTQYECLNEGGICQEDNPDKGNYREFDEWDCPQSEKCFINNDNHFTYGEYVQSFACEGIFIGTANIIPKETYAISYGSPTETCGWCGAWKTAGAIGGAITAGAVVVGGAVLVAGGGAASPFTFGGSLVLSAAGVAMVAGGIAGYTAADLTTDEIDKVRIKIISERKIPTVYLTTLNEIQKEDLCSLVET